MFRKRVITLDKDRESIDSTKYRGMLDYKKILRKISNSEESGNKEEMGESSKKLKRKFETMKVYEGDERVMFEFILRDFAKSEIWDNIKEPLSPKLNEDEHFICCENTTHKMNALKEARMESR
ncbi:hypothetical protein Tco_1333037 [Tanacetum coccineum]